MSPFIDFPVIRTVPDLVGLAYDEAMGRARRLDLHLADPDPDAPPISNFWWEHRELVVFTQHPAAGARIDRRDSVTITLGPPGAPVGARVRRSTPPVLSAEADDPPRRESS